MSGVGDKRKADISKLSLDDALIYVARATHFRSSDAYASGNAVRVCAEKFFTAQAPQITLIIEKIKSLPYAEKVDIIQVVTTIGVRMIHAITYKKRELWAEDERYRKKFGDRPEIVVAVKDTIEKLDSLLLSIKKKEDSPLISYACEDASTFLSRMSKEWLSTYANSIFSEGDEREVEIDYSDHSWFVEDVRLRERVSARRSGSTLYDEAFLHRIASDAIGLFDHTKSPQEFAFVQFDMLPKPTGPSVGLALLIRDEEETMKNYPYSPPYITHSMYGYMIDTPPEDLASVFGSDSTVLSRDEWIEFFTLRKKEHMDKKLNATEQERLTFFSTRCNQYDVQVNEQVQDSARKIVAGSSYQPVRVAFKKFNTIPSSVELNPYRGDSHKEMALLLQHLHRPGLRSRIEGDLGISFNDMPLRSQIHLLRFLASADKKTFKRFSQIMKQADTWKYEFLDAFMTASDQPSFGNVLLSVAERIGSDRYLGKNLFHRISMITRASADVSEYLRTTFHAHANQKKVRACIQHLMRRAQTILRAATTKSRDELLEISMDLPSEIVLFTAAFKALKESGEMPPLSAIEEVEFSIIKDDELRTFLSNRIHTEEMEWIYMSQYADPKYTPQFKEALLERFHSATQSEHATFYVIKHMGLVVAFCRFDRQDDGGLYFGSFVVSKHYENNKLGMALLEESLLKLGKTQKIEADCDPDSPAAKMYEKLGFVVTKRYDYHGVPSTHIVREPDNVRLRTQSAA